jgi:hypothetical protein
MRQRSMHLVALSDFFAGCAPRYPGSLALAPNEYVSWFGRPRASRPAQRVRGRWHLWRGKVRRMYTFAVDLEQFL